MTTMAACWLHQQRSLCSWQPPLRLPTLLLCCADRTKEFQFESVTFFVEENLRRYLAGQDLLNVCDKKAGY